MVEGIVVVIVVFVLIVAVALIARSAPKSKSAERQKFEASEEAENRVKEYRLNAEDAKIVSSAPKTVSQTAPNGNVSRTTGSRNLARRVEPRVMTPRIGLSRNLREEPHTHPSEPGVDYRVERVDVAGSLGADVSEGCADTYFTRLIKLGKEDIARPEPNYDLIKTVVFGELLSHPKFKK